MTVAYRMAGDAMRRGGGGSFKGMHAKQTHRGPGYGREPQGTVDYQMPGETEHAHPTRYETPEVSDRKQRYLNEKVADIQTSGQAGVMHRRPDTTVSDMTINKFMSGSGGNGTPSQSDGHIAGDTNLVGADWASHWKNENRRTKTDGMQFGLDSAQKFINQGAANQVVDREVLQKSLDQKPLYHQAKSTVQQHMNYGDIWNKDYKVPDWLQPDALKEVEKPDLSGDKWLDEIKDI